MAKVRITKRLPPPIAERAAVGDELEVTAQWGEAVEVRSLKGFTVRLLPDEFEWVPQCKCPDECGCHGT